MDIPVEAYEKLGEFYLGRSYDLEEREMLDDLLLYDSKDLTTHAVCVGMTGSGKTGLCISLLEEAIIDGIPALIIDPKGDIPNLMLTFPNLSPDEFLPWINIDDARKKNLSPEEFAAKQADLWKNGLASWGEGPDRVRKLRDAADVTIYTPGSEAGVPVSILSSFAPPSEQVREDRDLLNDRISSTATGLLGLLGIDADPLRSREHILISNLLENAWNDGLTLDLGSLIQAIQTPPFERIGVMNLDSFFPPKDRFELAMALNNLLASPGFETWMTGVPIDIDKMLYDDSGKPRVAILSIAHLSEAERMFFVSLLLNETLSWIRTKPGTTSLRALLYIDEIFGYMPPVANPPSKQPLLTLLKQARAYGLGVVLATQNPVDLDYKGLSNTGTWFIGRLQTERDKMRVLEGLEGASGGGEFDRGEMERVLAGLGKRVFLMHNVHEPAPEIFHTRWAMSYLRGPMTRTQIKSLMQDRQTAVASAATEAARTSSKAPASAPATQSRPVVPPDVTQRFLPSGSADLTHYEPRVIGTASVHFQDRKRGIETDREIALLAEVRAGAVSPVEWEDAERVDIDVDRLRTEPDKNASFGDLPAEAQKARDYTAWKKDLADWLYREERVTSFLHPGLGVASDPDESERDFRIRLR
ncbi:MAG: ATP-binding protein, partial [Rhodothermales bacterium]|nr:ATP-binding protein [Rhodothermales bacterium]